MPSAAAAEEVKEVSYRLQEAAGIVECVGLALRSLTRAEVLLLCAAVAAEESLIAVLKRKALSQPRKPKLMLIELILTQ